METTRTEQPLGYVVFRTTARTRRYFVGSRTGTKALVSDLQSDAWIFPTEEEARKVVRMAKAQHTGEWKYARLMPARKPTMSQDEIAAKVAARRADRKRNG